MRGSPQPPIGGELHFAEGLVQIPPLGCGLNYRFHVRMAMAQAIGGPQLRPGEGPHVAPLRKLRPDKPCDNTAACSRRRRRRRAEASRSGGPQFASASCVLSAGFDPNENRFTVRLRMIGNVARMCVPFIAASCLRRSESAPIRLKTAGSDRSRRRVLRAGLASPPASC